MFSRISIAFLVFSMVLAPVQPLHAFGHEIAKDLENAGKLILGTGAVLVCGLIVAGIQAERERARESRETATVHDALLDWLQEGKLTKQDFVAKGLDKRVLAHAQLKNRWAGPNGIKNLWESSVLSHATVLKN